MKINSDWQITIIFKGICIIVTIMLLAILN